MRRALSLPILLAVLGLPSLALAKRPFSFDDLAKVKRLSDFDVSADGRWVAYAITTVNVEENKSTSAIWLARVAGGEPRQLTAGEKKDSQPRFSPDGKRLAFVSDRGGTPQVCVLELAGGEAQAITKLSTGADGPAFSPDGNFLVFTSDVFPDCKDDKCNKERNERMEKTKVSGRLIERLLFRHWDSWKDGRRSHIFRVEVAGGEPKDLTPEDFDAPVFSLGGPRNSDVSPDGKYLCYGSNHDKVEAISTNSDLWEVSTAGGQARCLTCDNKAWDGTPRYSPDGRLIAYRAQRTAGYESDRFELRLYDRQSGKVRILAESFDDWVEDFAWSPDSKRICFTSTVKAHSPIFEADVATGAYRELVTGVTASDPHPQKDGSIVFSGVSLQRPAELYRVGPPPSGKRSGSVAGRQSPVALSHINDSLFAEIDMGEVRERWYDADGRKIHALMVLPPGFDEKKRYPALMWIHGGPQGAWEAGWSYRWNAQVLAAAGYVVYLPNPSGSTGYGQKFVLEISGDWGGKVYDDLMRGLDDLESLPFIDKARIGAAGASYGGFMINWIQGHTGRFAALFCHDGIANQETMYGTEELWFPEFEFKGVPWESGEYRKWSPMEHAKNFTTPELVVHGEKDYRVPPEQGIVMFTLLQRKGVPSKLLYFSNENHWVLKPADSRLWYATMIDWFHRYLGGAPADQKALDSAYSVTK